MKLQEGFIIGFDPCTRHGSHVLVTNDYKDTLVAYLHYNSFINRLDTIYKFSGCFNILDTDTAYLFPDYYYYDYRSDFLFPDSVRSKYKIYLNYSIISEENKIPIVCTMDIYSAPFEKCVKNRQIKINYATKYPTEYVKIKF